MFSDVKLCYTRERRDSTGRKIQAYIELDDGRKMYVWKARIGEKCEDYERIPRCGDGGSVIIQRVQIEGEPEKWAEE